MRACNIAGSPGILKIKPACNAVDINHLTRKEKARYPSAFKGGGVQFAQTYTTTGNKFFLKSGFALNPEFTVG